MNHIRGNDPDQWSSAPTFAGVQYDGVYPGIDLVYYGKQGQLEYDFLVAPGARPDAIGLRFAGVDAMRLGFDGALLLTAGGRELRWEAPVSYQRIDGARRAVASGYRLTQRDGTTTVGFTVGAHDAAHPLVIDPTLTYSTFLGGSDADRGYAIAVDGLGQAHTTGYTVSLDFPMMGAIDASHNGGLDVFVSKLNATGTALVYSTYIGGSGNDDGTGIALDAAGNVYVTGRTSNAATPFPVTAGAYDTTLNGSLDAFVLKLSAGAGALLYSTYVGGESNDEPQDIAVDTQGRAYIVGKTQSMNYPFTAGAYDTAYNGGAWDAFVTRLNATGTNLSYSTYFGGNAFDYGNGIVLSGNEAYIVGYTTSNNLPTIAGAYDMAYNGGGDAFVSRFDGAGANLLSSTFVGGAASDSGEDIARGGGGHLFITGWGSPGYPTTGGAYDTSHNGGLDVIVTKLNATLGSLTYSTFVGGATGDFGYGIAVNSAGGALVVGGTDSAATFPTVVPTQAAYGGGVSDAFVLRVLPTGAGLNFSTFLGSTDYEFAEGVALDDAGNPYLTGVCSNATFPTVPGSFDVTHNGLWDAFVAMYTM